ncbi:hypothetical protein G9464_20280 [Halostella sp. JP-L12]|uniref:DUF6684 family protein n=1 Tax=Halostella TaxID=1843185 RepID=UPI000EF7D3C5|nr:MULTISPECIES: DUF6684 family protein [Halostella]NHN49910.1 hypothetical protein [Halostella sp. JP-L12]
MSRNVFDRETILDLTVNVIPLGILVFFLGAFTLFNPFGWDSTYSLLQLGIVVTMMVSLSFLTYYSGKLIATDELEREGDEHGE